MNLRKFANGWAHLRSPVTAHLFWDMLFSSANANLTSSWVYFFLSLSLSITLRHTHTHTEVITLNFYLLLTWGKQPLLASFRAQGPL